MAATPPHPALKDVLDTTCAGLPEATIRNEAAGSAVRDSDDKTLFGDIFLPYLPEAFRLARWLTGNASDAEDVVQDAAVRAFRGIRTFGLVNARAWSLSIVRNTAYTWLGKNRPRDLVFTEDLPVSERQDLERAQPDGAGVETPEDIAVSKAVSEDVRRAVAQLPAVFREVIVLREMHELNYRDIAAITNLPIGTVMSRLSRARQMLIELLEGRMS